MDSPTDDQPSSLLMCLPKKIRLRIYDFVVCDAYEGNTYQTTQTTTDMQPYRPLAITHVCRKMAEEALNHVFNDSIFNIQTYEQRRNTVAPPTLPPTTAWLVLKCSGKYAFKVRADYPLKSFDHIGHCSIKVYDVHQQNKWTVQVLFKSLPHTTASQRVTFEDLTTLPNPNPDSLSTQERKIQSSRAIVGSFLFTMQSKMQIWELNFPTRKIVFSTEF